MSIHLMGAIALKQPSFAISEIETKKLAAAIVAVQAEYTETLLTRKQQAWLNLAAIGGLIYVPRIIAVSGAAKLARKGKAPAQPPQSADPIPTPAEVMASAPNVAPGPGYKGPLTPAQLFGPGMSGG